MVQGCTESENGEHDGVWGTLIKYSITKNGKVFAHFLGECNNCGCPIHWTAQMIQCEEYGPDTLEEEHFIGATEVYMEDVWNIRGMKDEQ